MRSCPRPRAVAAILLFPLIAAAPAPAATWIVNPDGSGDATTIQGGIDLAAATGDTVEVAPADYAEAPVVDAKSIVLRAASGRGTTRIGSAIRMQGVLPGDVEIAGFVFGGGVDVLGESQAVRITACDFEGPLLVGDYAFSEATDCSFVGLAVAVSVAGSFPGAWLTGCRFESNARVVELQGYSSSVRLDGCTILDNGEVIHSFWAWNPFYEGNHGGDLSGCMIEGNGLVLRAEWAFFANAPAPAPLSRSPARDAGFRMSDCDVVSNGTVLSVELNSLTATGSRFEGNNLLGGGAACRLEFDECLLVGNGGGISGSAVGIDDGLGSYFNLYRTTYHGNGGGISVSGDDLSPSGWTANRSILSGQTAGVAVPESSTYASVEVTCSDVWGNAGGDTIPPSADGGNNFSEDPLFCDAAAGDYSLQESSPCLPQYTGPCGLVGALPVGCGAVSIAEESWAAIKAKYR